VLALGKLNEPGWTYADVTLDAVRSVRVDGTVLNHAHWSEQERWLGAVETVRLGAPATAA
jgi:hypothetical protein